MRDVPSKVNNGLRGDRRDARHEVENQAFASAELKLVSDGRLVCATTSYIIALAAATRVLGHRKDLTYVSTLFIALLLCSKGPTDA
jgi:hypothetical protein